MRRSTSSAATPHPCRRPCARDRPVPRRVAAPARTGARHPCPTGPQSRTGRDPQRPGHTTSCPRLGDSGRRLWRAPARFHLGALVRAEQGGATPAAGDGPAGGAAGLRGADSPGRAPPLPSDPGSRAWPHRYRLGWARFVIKASMMSNDARSLPTRAFQWPRTPPTRSTSASDAPNAKSMLGRNARTVVR